MKKLRVAVLFGGRSTEHEVSLTSAASVIQALDPAKYEVLPIGISREGRWLVGRSLAESSTGKVLAGVIQNGEPVTASVDPTGPQLIPLDRSGKSAEIVRESSGILRGGEPASGLGMPEIDVVFPVLHGTFGEDGTIQGLLELAGLPYVGAGVLGSAAGMDKDAMKRLFRDAGLPVVPWITVLRGDWERNPEALSAMIGEKLGYPLFVKPANLGSSVGISKAHEAGELAKTISLAAEYDRKIVVEKAVKKAREIECAVLGNDSPEASVAGEVIPVNEFYDYEAKYVKEGSELIIPARITSAQSAKVRDFAVRAFKAIDAAGMGRVDFLLEGVTGSKARLFVNEINTIPGFTPISMYPKLWEASGLSYPKLVDRLIELALERHRERLRTRYS